MSAASRRTQQSFATAAANIRAGARGMGVPFGRGLRMIGEEIMTDVKAAGPGRGVPVDEGTLRSTGLVEGPTAVGAGVQVVLSFGGAAAPYALAQHERTDYNHRIGEARYLVRGLERWQPTMSRAVAALQSQVRIILNRSR